MESNAIFLDNEQDKDRLDYLSTNFRDVYKKFIEDSYKELKKEFEKIIPEKEKVYKNEI